MIKQRHISSHHSAELQGLRETGNTTHGFYAWTMVMVINGASKGDEQRDHKDS